MKRKLHILLLLLFQVSLLMAQDFVVRECTEAEIPSSRRADYYKEAHRIIENHYILLLESVGDSENRDVIIEQMMSDKNINTLKTEFLFMQDNNLTFCKPQQYYTTFEYIYKDLNDKVYFKVDNFKDGKIMMNSLVSCYIPVEYELTLMQGDETLFKRRCRMYCLFPKANASKLTKVMQVEPVEEIYNVNKFEASSEETMSFIDKFVIKFKAWPIFDKILYGLMLCLFIGSCIFSIIQVYAIYLDDKIKDLFKHIKNKRQFSQLLSQAKAGDVDAMKKLAAIYEYGNKSGNLSSNPESFKWYLNAAQKDDTESIYKVATCYEYGRGVEEDVTKAVFYYKKAAEFNHAEAQYQLGKHYQKGEGIIQSDKDAVEWFTRAAEQGLADALYQLGECYYNGWGVQVDYKNAIKYYTAAELRGNKEAIYAVAMCYKSGIGTIQSDEHAFVITNKSDSQITGTPDEWYRKGYDFYKNKDYTQAVVWYTYAAEKGHKVAQCYLGYCYKYGQGVPKSYEKAVEWYTKAANQGNEDAQCNLGYCYEFGQGVPKSYEKAVEWYTKAADQGYARAQCNLGACYHNGQGVPKSYEKAVEWYTKATNLGHATAQCNLGVCYEFGLGVPKSYEKAVEWYTKAADQGYENAKIALKRIKDKL